MKKSKQTPQAPARSRTEPFLWIVTPLFFLSGFTGLVYEVTWTRMFTAVFGNTTYAVSAVLAAFMGGLALGSFLIGRFVDRRTHLLKIFAALELGIGASALAMPAVLDALDGVYAPLYQRFPASTWLLMLVRTILSFVVLLVPTFLMGGTLPVLAKFLVRRAEQSGARVAVLYAVNTLGATLGCFLTGFWFIELLGVSRTIRFTALANVALAAVFFLLGLGLDAARREAAVERPREKPSEPRRLRVVFIAFALAGFVALALEVLWTRLLVFRLNTTVYAFAIMLTTFLAGIGLGSLVYSAVERTGLLRNHFRAFGVIESVIGLCGLLSIPLFGSFESITALWGATSWRGEVTQKLLLAAVIMIVPTLLMGVAFPLVTRLVTRNVERVGSVLGQVYAVNTAGSILGALLAGFLLVRLLGTQASIVLVSLIALGVGSWVLRSRVLVPAFWAAALVVLVATPSNSLFQYYNIGQRRVNSQVEILAAYEGVECVTTVHRFPDGRRVIATGSMNVAGTGLTLRTTQKLQAHIPMLFHPQPRAVLQVGFGSGETSHILTTYDTEQVDIVEISRGVLETSAKHFTDINHGVVEHPKFRAIVMDGANYLALTDEKYDVIMNDSIWPYYSGNSGLYTREYFADGKAHLKPGGIMTSWLPIEIPEASFKSLLNTFHSVFPHVSLWMAVTHFNKHALIMGSDTPLSVDAGRFLERFERYAREDLAVIHLDDPVFFLDSFKTDESGFAGWVERAPLHTLEHPVLEFAPRRATAMDWARSYELVAESGISLVPKLSGASPDLERALEAARRATKLVMQGLIKREKEEGDFMRQFELALAQAPDHPGARVLIDEVRQWRDTRSADLERAGFTDLLRIGEEFLENNLPEKAVQALGRAIALQPDSAIARHNLGIAYYRLGRMEPALVELNAALRHDPSHAPSYKLRGAVRSLTGDHQAALADLSKAIELDPRDPLAHFNRGLTLASREQFDQALRDLDRAIELKPDLAEAYYVRGTVHESRRVTARALEDYSKAISLDPTHVEAYYNRGMLQAQGSRYASAIEDFSRVIELSPSQADAYYYRGLAYKLSGDPSRAQQDFERAAGLDPAYRARSTPR